ncbi:hypothetical protein NM688_g9328 [Phlebia brevispora]|uniref:Uncharacterized protein n=1 Tax=Phlebia brevispora TaxID=194682 RepID=A0ACC1RKH1_9APHY|nr:hypothetical protein NM688_g9328 [Phlebia brevispora]
MYSPLEMDVMLEDIRAFKQAGADGFVFGVLKPEGRVDLDRTFILAAQAAPLQVCFHRAFDMTRDPIEALRDLKSIPGMTRILTSGHGQKAPSSISVLQKLLRESKRVLTIMPGSGINPDTIGPLLESLAPYGLKEFHLSAGEWIQSEMTFRPEGMGMGIGGDGEWGIWRTKEETVRAVRKIADDFQAAREDKRPSFAV